MAFDTSAVAGHSEVSEELRSENTMTPEVHGDTKTNGQDSTSSPCRPKPKFNIGDEVTKKKLSYRVENKDSLFFDSDSYEPAWSREHECSLTFIIKIRCYDEETGQWCYMGRAKPRMQLVRVQNFGVWAWEWEVAQPVFNDDQLVKVDLANELLRAKIKSTEWRPKGVFYEVNLGVAEFAEEEVKYLEDRYNASSRGAEKIYEVTRKGCTFWGPEEWREDRGGSTICGLDLSYSGLPEDSIMAYDDYSPIMMDEASPTAYETDHLKVSITGTSKPVSADSEPVGAELNNDFLLKRPKTMNPLIEELAAGAWSPKLEMGELILACFDGNKVSFGRVVAGVLEKQWRSVRYCVELFDVASRSDSEVLLDADRQELVQSGQSINPLVRYGVVKTGYTRSPAIHAGDVVTVHPRGGTRSKCRVKRVTLEAKYFQCPDVIGKFY